MLETSFPEEYFFVENRVNSDTDQVKFHLGIVLIPGREANVLNIQLQDPAKFRVAVEREQALNKILGDLDQLDRSRASNPPPPDDIALVSAFGGPFRIVAINNGIYSPPILPRNPNGFNPERVTETAWDNSFSNFDAFAQLVANLHNHFNTVMPMSERRAAYDSPLPIYHRIDYIPK